MFKNRVVVGTMVMAAAMFAGQAVYAEAPGTPTFGHSYSKTKLVSFNMRNDTNAPLKVLAGDKEITLQPGKVVPVRLEAGVKIVAAETTPAFAAGTVLSVVSDSLSDATIGLK